MLHVKIIFNILLIHLILELCRAYRDIQSNHAQLVERLVGGKMNKPQFVDVEAVLIKKRDEIVEKFNHLVNTL